MTSREEAVNLMRAFAFIIFAISALGLSLGLFNTTFEGCKEFVSQYESPLDELRQTLEVRLKLLIKKQLLNYVHRFSQTKMIRNTKKKCCYK